MSFEIYDASSAQKRLYLINQMYGDNTLYNIPSAWFIEGNLNYSLLEAAVNKLIQRHETLRTSFLSKDGEVLQKVHLQMDFHLEVRKIKSTTDLNIYSIISSFVHPFDLNQLPLWKMEVIELQPKKFLMILDMHHIISDGASLGVMFSDLMKLYMGQELPELEFQYVDFTLWQNEQWETEQIKRQEQYWMNVFKGDIPVLNLPLDFPVSPIPDFKGNIIDFHLDPQMSAGLKQLVLKSNSTLFIVLLSIYSLLLSKYTGQEDIIIGSPISGRIHSAFEPIIGMFVNTLAIRTQPNGNKTFNQFLKEVNTQVFSAFENQDYPFEMLVEKLLPQRQLNQNPLFETMFVLQNFSQNLEIFDSEHNAIKCEPYVFQEKVSKFQMILAAVEVENKIAFELQYRTSVFLQETIERYIKHFIRLSTEILKNPNVRLRDLEIITEKERKYILTVLNDTHQDYPKNKSISQLFLYQSEKTPDHIALVESIENLGNNPISISYRELDYQSENLANLLKSKGIQSDSIVGTMIERSITLIITLIATLKAGGAYLPLSPNYPEERISYMLNDSNATHILSDREIGHLSYNQSAERLLPGIFYSNTGKAGVSTNQISMRCNSTLAYIAYTSGTTGKPKGVLVENKNVIRLVKNTNYIHFDENHRILQTGALEFDASTFEIWGSLLNGMQLNLVGNEIILAADKLKLAVKKNKISIMWLTAPLFNQLLEQDIQIFEPLSTLLVGGDALSPSHIYPLRNRYPYLKIINGYGPTENTTFSTTYTIKEEYTEKIPIGKAIANSTAYIVNTYGQLQPIGVAGELWVGGDGVARGYLNNPELTAQKFLPNTFNSDTIYTPLHTKWSLGGGTIYTTGDLARWLPNGLIEFLGRKDKQVKIRGYRIELGEIENRLSNHPEIKEAIVLPETGPAGDKYLCAYLVSTQKEIAYIAKNFLSNYLPEYMIPSYFVRLEKLPLKANGKIDLKALPNPTQNQTKRNIIAPRDTIEKTLVQIWSDVLNIKFTENNPTIGIDDDFFHLGGHSLKATVMVAKIQKQLNANISLVEFFKKPSIRNLAILISDSVGLEEIKIEPVEHNEYYPLSSAQKRLYTLQQMDINSTVYNIPQYTVLEGNIDERQLTRIFQHLIQRHESLRTSFFMVNDEPVQKIENVDFKLEKYYHEPPTNPTSEKETSEQNIITNFVRPFDLSKAPLVRIGILELSKIKHILMIDIHHIISDGYSQNLLITDFISLTSDPGKELEKTFIQYKDYSIWQNSDTHKLGIKKQEKFWLDKFQTDIPLLDLPTDFPRPAVQNFTGDRIQFHLNHQETASLKQFTQQPGVTLFMVTLSLFNILLAKLNGHKNEDIVVGTVISGRRHANLEKVIGMFVNTLVLRNSPYRDATFLQFLENVKETSVQTFDNQDYPFEDLVEDPSLNILRVPGRNPLFDAMFAFQNLEFPEIQLPNLKLKPYKSDQLTKTSKFDLSFIGFEKDEQLQFVLEYSTHLFKSSTIQRFIGYFQKIVSIVIQNPKITLEKIGIIGKEEKRQLLLEMNRTATPYPHEKSLPQLFQETVQQNSGRIALIGPGINLHNNQTEEKLHLTYDNLDRNVQQLVSHLKENGITPDTIIGLMVERSIEMITAILAILHVNGAYLPIEWDYPQERIRYMLSDSGVPLLLTTGEMIEKFKTNDLSKLLQNNSKSLKMIDLQQALLKPTVTSTTPATTTQNSSSAQLAYVIYTSGTTGKPKGTLTTHFNVSRVVRDTNYIRINTTDRILQLSNYAFDGSIFDIYGALLNAAALILIKKKDVLDVNRLTHILSYERITVFFITTALFNAIVDLKLNALTNTRKILIGGEQISLPHAKRALEVLGKNKLINAYGPTETTVFATYFFIDSYNKNNETIPIGQPISNTSIYIVTIDLQLAPVGVSGELLIGGDGLARGYLNQPELTFEKFNRSIYSNCLLDRHLTTQPLNHSTLYHTGDLARWNNQYFIEFIGRIDQQVKIRGFRIEPGEIENHLIGLKEIDDAIVIVKSNGTEKYICAYIVLNSGVKPDIAILKSQLSVTLPEYMIPSHFLILDKIPLNPNGKVDKHALPDPVLTIEDDYVPPRNEIERELVQIWSRILGIETDKIGIDTNFFTIGGHSLKATILAARIHKEMGVQIPLAELFISQTIRHQAQYIQNTERTQFISVEPEEKKDYYPLSSAQKRLFILHQIEPTLTAYNMPAVIPFSRHWENIALENVFNQLILRHESLRTSFHIVNEEPVQRIQQQTQIQIEYYGIEGKQFELNELTSLSGGYTLSEALSQFVRPFDLKQAPLLRFGLFNTGDSKYILIDMHHIISDGTSMTILTKEFNELEHGRVLSPLKIQYTDFSIWQNRFLQSESIKTQEFYWLKSFTGDLPILTLPYDKPRPLIQGFEGANTEFSLNSRQSHGLTDLSVKYEVTLYMVILSIYTIVLSKLSNQEDIIIGTPVAGRRHADLEAVIGMFVNTLPIRNFPSAEKSFIQFLQEVKTNTLDAFENQEFQFEELVEKISIKRDTSRNPIFDVMFNLLNHSGNETENDNHHHENKQENKIQQEETVAGNRKSDTLQLKFEHQPGTSKFDLNLTAIENVTSKESNLIFNLEYSTNLFTPYSIERIIEYFKQTIDTLLDNQHLQISSIDILGEEEKERLLIRFNQTAGDYRPNIGLHHLFMEQAEKNPFHTAIIGQGVETEKEMYLSYNELNHQSTQLALSVMEKGAQTDTIVALLIDRSIEMIIGVLGILKSGAAYLPIDPETPKERIEFLLKDSNAKIVVANQEEFDKPTETLKKNIINELSLVSFNERNTKPDQKSISIPHSPMETPNHSLAYIIYTSGSSGKPKGVLIRHYSVMNILTALSRKYPLLHNHRYLLKTSFTFDVSISELFGWYWQGGQLGILGKNQHKDPEKILKAIQFLGITHINFVPSMFSVFLEGIIQEKASKNKLSQLNYIFLAGEALPPQQVERFRQLGTKVQLENLYGPTEATIYASGYSLECWQSHGNIPIGNPLQNVETYILDKAFMPTALGVIGELFIAGHGIARGYLNRPELTEEKFIQPLVYSNLYNCIKHFTKSNSTLRFNQHSTIYRTGDIAKFQPDGNIEFLGRIDHQIKIRGFRIELGEIENHLRSHSKILDAVVIDKTHEDGDIYLCAYIVLSGEITEVEIKEYLTHKVPPYMIPLYIIPIDHIPINASGKVNRNDLPLPKTQLNKNGNLPGNNIEEKLMEIWSDLLPIESSETIGTESNFFELGGHSLKATLLATRIHKTFNVKTNLGQIFKTPTIKGLAKYIEQSGKEIYSSIKPIEKRDYYPVSSAQKRMFILNQLKGNDTSDNTPLAVIVEGNLERTIFEGAIRRIIQKHESLRTSFHVIEEEPVQVIHSHIEFQIAFDELEKQSVEQAIREFVRPFDLTQASLLRVGIVAMSHQQYVVICDMHHIIVDGTAKAIFVDEFITQYQLEIENNQSREPMLRIQYKDFTLWQNRILKSEYIKKQEDYWYHIFGEGANIPCLNMPTDFPRPSILSYEGNSIDFCLEKELSQGINTFLLENNVTLYMFLLATYTILLAKWTDQKDIIVGTPIAGRPHTDLENIIGMFANTLAMRNYPEDEKTFLGFLHEVKINSLNAYENQDYQFETLVNRLGIEPNPGRNPLFDTMFVVQNLGVTIRDPERHLKSLSFRPFEFEEQITQFDIITHALGGGKDESISFKMRYSIKLFKKETIERFFGFFREIIEKAIGNPEILLKDIHLSHGMFDKELDIFDQEDGDFDF